MDKDKNHIKQSIILVANNKITSGWKQQRIIDHLQDKYPDVPLGTIFNLYKSAKQTVEGAYCLEREYNIGLHLERYNNKILDLMLSIEQVFEADSEDSYPVFVALFSGALETLKQKEQLVGMHSKDFKIIIHNIYKKIEIKRNTKTTFNLDVLEINEQIELMNLLKKAKQKDN